MSEWEPMDSRERRLVVGRERSYRLVGVARVSRLLGAAT